MGKAQVTGALVTPLKPGIKAPTGLAKPTTVTNNTPSRKPVPRNSVGGVGPKSAETDEIDEIYNEKDPV